MESGGAKIQEIEIYECGYCVNHVEHVLRGEKAKKVEFPALVVRMKHKDKGNILFDTGYSERIYNNGWKSYLYNLINPTYIKNKDNIANQLKRQNIEKVDKIILSHPHPDHIGCLKDFRDYDLIATKECWIQMKQKRTRNLVFANLVPENFNRLGIKKYIAKPMAREHFLKSYFSKVYDLLGDGSIIGVSLDGHSKGQIGIYLPEYNVIFAADASWGGSFAKKVESMRFIPRMIQNDYEEYKRSIAVLERLAKEHSEIKIVYTHEEPAKRREVTGQWEN